MESSETDTPSTPSSSSAAVISGLFSAVPSVHTTTSTPAAFSSAMTFRVGRHESGSPPATNTRRTALSASVRAKAIAASAPTSERERCERTPGAVTGWAWFISRVPKKQ